MLNGRTHLFGPQRKEQKENQTGENAIPELTSIALHKWKIFTCPKKQNSRQEHNTRINQYCAKESRQLPAYF